MNAVVCLLIIAAVAVAAVVELPTDVEDVVQVQQTFEMFERQFGKTYASVDERQRRFAVFHTNLRDIAQRNAKRASAEAALFGVTKFTDLTADEFRASVLMQKPIKTSKKATKEQKRANKETLKNVDVAALPTLFDWRTKRAVTPVKDQGQCGR